MPRRIGGAGIAGGYGLPAGEQMFGPQAAVARKGHDLPAAVGPRLPHAGRI